MTTPLNASVVCPMLIGRTAELAAFHLLLEQAKGGEGHVALLSGEAGVGKSRLVAEVFTSAAGQGFLLLQGNCFQADRYQARLAVAEPVVDRASLSSQRCGSSGGPA